MCGSMGAASLKMNTKMAAMPMILLQPQAWMSHSVGFSTASTRLNFLRDVGRGGWDTAGVGVASGGLGLAFSVSVGEGALLWAPRARSPPTR